MTRIVAGLAKGRRLSVPQRGTRPTSDRAREAMFNTLRAHLDLEGARVVDLFAGSGAVGLEALSRGAAASVLVESDRAAADVILRNIAAVGLPGAVLHRRTAESFLAEDGPDAPFHLAFADPPYTYPDEQLAGLLVALADGRWLADRAVVVVERSARAAEPPWPEGIALVTQRQYGEGALWYGRDQP
ncbi:MAG TPA: 16S rRNA (guanine(966)-N(2))-methyltransferase RsmD [Jatrophihabitantaceae bacterium]